MDAEAAKKAFAAGQDAAYREQVTLWASDETVTDEEFSRLVLDLAWQQGMARVHFNGTVSGKEGVDESQPGDVE